MASSAVHQPSSDFASFADDPNISFDKETGKWRYETEDGNELEFDVRAQAWVPVLDEELLKAQQAAYSVEGVDEEAVAAPVAARAKKRKEVDYTSNTDPAAIVPAKKRGKKNGKGEPSSSNGADTDPSSSSQKELPPTPPSKNTAVFVSGLPPDTTAAELAARFGKFGVLMEDDEGAPKIKLYANDDGNFNGEALVVYFMEDSVDLAIRMLDEAELRLGEPGTLMRVKRGEFGHKSAGTNGERATVKRVVDKKKASARITKMKSKLADWDSDEDDPLQAQAPKSRTVLLKHMFTLQELEQDVGLLLELKDDVREECETLGEVTNVVLYDLEPDGIMTVKFKDLVSARACVLKMNGRFFDGRQVIATLFDGKASKFRRSDRGGAPNPGDDDDEDAGDDDEKKRLDKFAEWLEQDGGGAKSTNDGS